jgi:Xaa-Pro dipeptidase
VTAAWPQGADCCFPRAETARRQQALIARLEAAGAGALLLSSPENIFWATGRQTAGHVSLQVLVLQPGRAPVLVVRELESFGARSSTFLDDIVTYSDAEDPARAIAALLPPGVTVALEKGALSALRHEALARALAPRPLLDASGLAETLRRVKSPLELEFIRRAAACAEAALAAGIETCAAGVSENAIAARMLATAVEAGSEAMAMEPLVSSGPRSGIPHATWRRRRLQEGDPVFLELAASYNRYHAALMRPVWIGPPPAIARAMMECARRAFDAALAKMVPGTPCAEVHDAAERVVEAAGLGPALRKRIGYSMGAAFSPDWGEGNVLSLYHDQPAPLEAGMVFHIPLVLRRFAEFSVGLSETVIVTEHGPEPLSGLPQEIVLR